MHSQHKYDSCSKAATNAAEKAVQQTDTACAVTRRSPG